MPDQQIAADIAATRDYIAEHGWCQGSLEDDDGKVCLMGAVNAATMGVPFFPNAQEWLAFNPERRYRNDAVLNFLSHGIAQEMGYSDILDYYDHEVYGTKLKPVAYYNDKKLKSTAEVLAFLDKQIIRAEETA